MAEHAGDKSFEATPHRRQEAREKGQVAYSQDLGSAALLLAGVLLLMMLGSSLLAYCTNLMRDKLGALTEFTTSEETMLHECLGIALALATLMLPILGLLMLGGILASVLQIGFLWVPERVAPDVSRLDPLAGLKRIFSLTGTM